MFVIRNAELGLAILENIPVLSHKIIPVTKVHETG